MLTFLHPWMFWLAGLPILVNWILPPLRVTSPAVRVPFISRLKAAGGKVSSSNIQRPSLIVPSIIWLLVLSALARPQWLEPPIKRTIPTRDLLILVDLSGSMVHKDFTNEAGQTVDRLTAVKEVLGEFLVRREGDRVGLIVFGTAPFIQVPLTTDLSLCRQLLDETAVGMAGPKTALGDAIGLGIKSLNNSDTTQKTIIAVTDGNDTASGIPPIEAARIARNNEITIHTIAIGDPTTTGEEKLDELALRDVASTAGGKYFLALNRQELAGVYEHLDEIETRDIKTESHRPRRDLYFWPLGLALILSLSSYAIQIFRQGIVTTQNPKFARIRVNSRTFELEIS